MSRNELRTSAPLWLEFSGLPEFLGLKIKGNTGWLLFKKICELDCERNSAPGTVEISLGELVKRTGISSNVLRKTAIGLRKLKLIATFLPDNDEEAALFRIVTPLFTPLSVDAIKAADPHLFEHSGNQYRYASETTDGLQEDMTANNTDLQEVVDSYFDVVGLKMNAFILDELRMLPQRFSMQEIRNVFRRARKNEIRSLHWIMQELVKLHSKSGNTPVIPAQTPISSGSDDDTFKF